MVELQGLSLGLLFALHSSEVSVLKCKYPHVPTPLRSLAAPKRAPQIALGSMRLAGE